MARKSKIPISCRLGRHDQTYSDSLIVVDVEVKRCRFCHAIPDPVQAELWELESLTMEALQDMPLRERFRRVRYVVLGAMQAHT